MQKYISIPLVMSSLLFAGSVFADQLKFSSSAVSSSTAGGPSPTAMLTSTAGGTPTTAMVVLPKTIAIKDLKTGDVVFIPAPNNSVYRVSSVTPNPDGSVTVEVEDTFLTPKPAKGSSMMMTPSTTTPDTTTSPSMTAPTTTAPAKTGGY